MSFKGVTRGGRGSFPPPKAMWERAEVEVKKLILVWVFPREKSFSVNWDQKNYRKFVYGFALNVICCPTTPSADSWLHPRCPPLRHQIYKRQIHFMSQIERVTGLNFLIIFSYRFYRSHPLQNSFFQFSVYSKAIIKLTFVVYIKRT